MSNTVHLLENAIKKKKSTFFVKSTILLKSYYICTVIDFTGKFWTWSRHTMEIAEIHSYRKNISSNHLFRSFFGKNVRFTFTKFCQKRVSVNFRKFHSVRVLQYFSTLCFSNSFIKRRFTKSMIAYYLPFLRLVIVHWGEFWDFWFGW